MSLLNKLNKSHLFRNLVYYPLVAGLISLSSCTKDSSSPSGPNNHSGENNDYVENNGNTNSEGELGLEVEGQKFNFYVQDKDDGRSLNNIKISGAYFLNNIYGFLAEDFSYNYFSNVIYVDLNSNYSTSGENVGTIDINQELNKIRGEDYIKEDSHSQDEPYIYSLSDNPRLSFVGTFTLDDLHGVYVDNDAIFRNISYLEFIANVTNRPELTFALEAAQFRQTFIENLSNYNDIANSIARFFGGSFEKEAYYIDVYMNSLGILTHESSQRGYGTLKGYVWDPLMRGISESSVQILSGPIIKSTSTKPDGLYFLKFLRDGDYILKASAPGFEPLEKDKWFVHPYYLYPACGELNFPLQLIITTELDTLVLQPGPNEGKDASVLSLNPTTNYGDGDFLNVAYNPWGNGDVWRSYLFLDISSIPQNSTVRSAKLYMRGASGQEGEGLDDAYIAIKKVLDNWNESQINWSNQPRFDPHTYAVSIFSHWPSYEWKSFDLVDLIQGWVNNGDNKGIAIVLDQESGRRTAAIYSSDISNADFRYKVEVIYEH